MGRRTMLLLSLVGAMLFACSGVVLAQQGRTTETEDSPSFKGQNGQGFASRQLIVKLKDGASTEDLEELNRRNGARTDKQLAPNLVPGLHRVTLPPGLTVRDAVGRYKGSGVIEYAEPDFLVSADTHALSDPKYNDGSLWGLNNTGQNNGTNDADIDAPEAWDITTGDSGTVVAVIDTGVDYNHPDLDENIWTNPDTSASDVHGYDFYNNDGDPMDDNNHGTHVSGTIAAEANSEGVVGVNWTAQIMPLKFLGANGTGMTSDAEAALDYAVANGAKISNNSWGGGGFSQSLLDTLKEADAAGHLFVAAAGNNGWNTDSSPHYPSSYNAPNVVSVAATDKNDTLASFSNYGKTSVDLAAPGVSIWSTVWNESNPSYASYNGTSMAAPHVAGAAALIKVKKPTLDDAGIKERLLGQNVDPISNLADKTVTGGRLNLPKTLNPAPTVSNVSPSSDVTGVRLNTDVTASFSDDMDPATLTTSTFTLAKNESDGSTTPVPATVSYDVGTKTAKLERSSNLEPDLEPETKYTATVKGGAADCTSCAQDMTGNPLAADKVWSFTTQDIIPPTVEFVSPSSDATGVGLATNVTARFSEDVRAATLTSSTFTLAKNESDGSTTPVPATVSYDVGTKTAKLDPSSNLEPNTKYTATVKGGTDGVKDKVGNSLDEPEEVWSFTTTDDVTPPTVESVSPLVDARDVLRDTNVEAKFLDEDIVGATVTRDTFMLAPGPDAPTPTTRITAAVSYDPKTRTAKLNPYGSSTSVLERCKRYTAKVTSGITDEVGNPAVEKVWTFKTRGC